MAPNPVPGWEVGPPGAAAAYDPVAAMRLGWDRFVKDPATLLVPVIVGSVLQGLVLTLFFVGFVAVLLVAVGNSETSSSSGVADRTIAVVLVLGIAYVVAFAAFQIVYAGWIKGGLDIVAGKRPAFAELYAGWSKGAVFGAALVLTALVWLGSFLWWLPSLAVVYFGQFALHFMLDRGAGVVGACTGSARLVARNAAKVALFDLLATAAVLAGTLAFGLGAFVAVPVVIIAQAHTFRVLAG
ncbi:MAG: hypothetical protein V9G19_24195 [Tetrasphaera sp.]